MGKYNHFQFLFQYISAIIFICYRLNALKRNRELPPLLYGKNHKNLIYRQTVTKDLLKLCSNA